MSRSLTKSERLALRMERELGLAIDPQLMPKSHGPRGHWQQDAGIDSWSAGLDGGGSVQSEDTMTACVESDFLTIRSVRRPYAPFREVYIDANSRATDSETVSQTQPDPSRFGTGIDGKGS